MVAAAHIRLGEEGGGQINFISANKSNGLDCISMSSVTMNDNVSVFGITNKQVTPKGSNR